MLRSEGIKPRAFSAGEDHGNDLHDELNAFPLNDLLDIGSSGS
jgi:hypothetical protein